MSQPVVITTFEIPPTADLAVDAGPGGRVHRALAPDARFRYITVGATDPVARLVGAAGAPIAHIGRYEVHHVGERAAPAYDAAASGEGALTFINCLEVAPGDEVAAFAVWSQVNAYMVRKPGYVWHRLHRRLSPDTPYGFVNVVRWESVAAWEAAHDEGFRALTGGPLPFRPLATLCEELATSAVPAPRASAETPAAV